MIKLSMSKANFRDKTSFDLFLDAQSLLKMLGMTGAMTLGIMTLSIMTSPHENTHHKDTQHGDHSDTQFYNGEHNDIQLNNT